MMFLCLSASVCVFAESSEVSDTSDSLTETVPTDFSGYMPISTKEELNNVRNDLTGKYYLTCDIVFTEEDFAEGGAFYNEGNGWKSIGSKNRPFTGVFDGNGHTVSGLKQNSTTDNSNVIGYYAGLFGYNSGTINGVGFLGGTIYHNFTYSSGYIYTGGIAGGNEGIIRNCYNTSKVVIVACATDLYGYAGGVVGKNDGIVSNCCNSGEIIVESTKFEATYVDVYAGGIAGYNLKKISDCYNTGAVSTKHYYPSHEYAGGIAGRGEIAGIERCYNIGNIWAKRAGGIIGSCGSQEGNMETCFYLNNLETAVGSGKASAIQVTDEELRNESKLSQFDFKTVWEYKTNEKYPYPSLKSLTYTDIPDNTGSFTSGNGSVYAPYVISNKEQLLHIREKMYANYKLEENIILTDSDFEEGGLFYNKGELWEPIGANQSYWTSFIGTFDGNGHTISGLKVTNNRDNNNGEYNYTGMFANNGGVIKNIGILNADINIDTYKNNIRYTDIYTGVIVGFNYGKIINCYSSGKVLAYSKYIVGSNYQMGGLVGRNEGVITHCYNMSKIKTTSYGYGYDLGGIAGINDGELSNCFNKGEIWGGTSIGGIAGRNEKNISCSFNVGEIGLLEYSDNTTRRAGGLIGSNYGNIENCYNVGAIICDSAMLNQVGGIAGTNSRRISKCYNVGILENGRELENKNIIGGIVGDNDGDINECYYINYEDNGIGNGNGNDQSLRLTDAELRVQDSFTGFDFKDTWGFESKGIYPYPTLKELGHKEVEDFANFAGGNGTVYKPYIILNKQHLSHVKENLHCYYKLGANIKLSDSDFMEGGLFYNDGKGWKPIGTGETLEQSFTGVFDGQGYTINGLRITKDNDDKSKYIGLFGRNVGEIKNLGISNGLIKVNSLITHTNNYVYMAGIAGRNDGQVSNCFNAGVSIEFNCRGAGIVGYNRGIVSKCYNTATIESIEEGAAGVVWLNFGEIYECFNSGRVSATSTPSSYAVYSAGLVYDNEEGIIHDCYNCGTITANPNSSDIAVGLVVYRGKIIRCYNVGKLSASYKEYGIARIVEKDNDVQNCYYLDSTALSASNDGDKRGRLSHEEFLELNKLEGFDFEQVWSCDFLGDYPYPQLQGNWMTRRIKSISLDNQSTDLILSTEGMDPDLSGIFINITYDDDTICRQPIDIRMIPSFDKQKIGLQEVAVSYAGQISEMKIGIQVVEKELSGICIKQAPSKLIYVKGVDDLDVSGGIIELQYNNGTKAEIPVEKEMVDGFDKNKEGIQELNIQYNGLSTSLKVEVVKIESIQVGSLPSKLTYVQGQPLNTEGGTLEVIYGNGDSGIIDLSKTQISYSKNQTGKVTVDVIYYDYKTSFDIVVNEKVAKSVEITDIPEKVVYVTGEKLNLNGGFIKVTYISEDNYYEVMPIKEDMISGYDPSLAGLQTLDVRYGDASDTFAVNVVERVLQEVHIDKIPMKTVYLKGEELTVKGGTLALNYNNISTEYIAMLEEMISDFDSSTIGTKEVMVHYDGYTTSFEIEVIDDSFVNIEMTKLPENNIYKEGDTQIDLSGGEITLTYADGSTRILDAANVVVSEILPLEVGTQELQIQFGALSFPFVIDVEPRGSSLIGTAISWNDKDDAIYLLYGAAINDSIIKEDLASENPGSDAIAIAEKGEIIQMADKECFKQNFSFDGIIAGDYKFVISKKGQSTLKIVNLSISEGGTQTIETTTIYQNGDVNENGTVDIFDLQRLYEHLNGSNPLSNISLGDVNDNGVVDIFDLQRLYEHLNGSNPL